MTYITITMDVSCIMLLTYGQAWHEKCTHASASAWEMMMVGSMLHAASRSCDWVSPPQALLPNWDVARGAIFIGFEKLTNFRQILTPFRQILTFCPVFWGPNALLSLFLSEFVPHLRLDVLTCWSWCWVPSSMDTKKVNGYALKFTILEMKLPFKGLQMIDCPGEEQVAILQLSEDKVSFLLKT